MTAVSLTTPFIGAVKDEWQLFSDRAEDYTRGPPIGFGSSSIVYYATYRPKGSQNEPIPCALKVLDLDRLPGGSLHLLQRETQLMSLSKHPNVLRVRGSWLDGHKLHIALRLMNAGSAADVMHYAWPGGMEEEVVRCILKQALEGLNYLHVNGFIHRDIKAANLLIDDNGTVLLGDLGVAAPLHDEDHTHTHTHTHTNDTSKAFRAVIFDLSSTPAPRRTRIGKRRSFVGTPCWMAPELISGVHYDSSADIWSFGITALELAQGRAPRSRESSRTVLSHIVKAAPPTLDREGGVHKYSRTFKELVERCLVKDPSLRPTAAELLHTPFFKNAKKPSYLVGTILRDLPALAKRLERRKQASLALLGTTDSWDFPTTLRFPSPTQSVFHRPRLDNRISKDERDEEDGAPEERTGGAPLEVIRDWSRSSTAGQDRVALQSVGSQPTAHALSPSKPPLGDGSSAASSSPEWMFANTSADGTSTAQSTPISILPPVALSVPASPRPSSGLWWRRIRRRSTSQSSKEDSPLRSTFINSVRLGGRGGREAIT